MPPLQFDPGMGTERDWKKDLVHSLLETLEEVIYIKKYEQKNSHAIMDDWYSKYFWIERQQPI